MVETFVVVMAFQLLPVPNFVLPATYAGWQAVDENQLAAIKVVWTSELLIDVHDSQLFTACPSAFTASQVNGRAVAPLRACGAQGAKRGPAAAGPQPGARVQACGLRPCAGVPPRRCGEAH